jgi:GNAT superfamily N-acetyltransferase
MIYPAPAETAQLGMPVQINAPKAPIDRFRLHARVEAFCSTTDQRSQSTACLPGGAWMLRQLELADMGSAARVLRTAFDHALPSLVGLHTPAEDRWFFREQVFTSCEVWGAFDNAAMTGILAFREGWIDQLYVLPTAQGRGIGTQLLRIAQRSFDRLQLWTFQRNTQARRFYGARGFVLVEETDGARNEEKEPDALYLWTRS